MIATRIAASFAAGLCVLLSQPALANYACTGPVKGVTVSPGGVVAAENAGGLNWPYFCSVNTAAVNGIDPAACKAIYALLLAAESQGKSVTLWFNDDPNTCATKTAWTWLTGWYWGPKLMD